MSEEEIADITAEEMAKYQEEYNKLPNEYKNTGNIKLLKKKLENVTDYGKLYNVYKLIMVVENMNLDNPITNILRNARKNNIDISLFYDGEELEKIVRKVDKEIKREEEMENEKYEKEQQNKLLSNVTEVSKNGVVHIVNFNLDSYEIRNDIFLKTLNEKFILGESLGMGTEGTVSKIGEYKVVKISNNGIFTKESLINFMKEYCEEHPSETSLSALYSDIDKQDLVNDENHDFNDILNFVKDCITINGEGKELLKSYFEEELKKYIQKTNSIANSTEEMRNNSVFPSNFYVLTDKYGQFTIIEISEEKEQNLRTAFDNEEEMDGLKIMNQIFDTVETMHTSGVINRDIKPANVILDKKGNAFLIDYGLAKSFDEKDDNGVGGTPFFRAPEIFKEGNQNSKSDVYSLGITFLETVLEDHSIINFFNNIIEKNGKFKNKTYSPQKEYYFASNITKCITSDIIDLTNFVPKGIKLKEGQESELKNRIVELLKKMLEANPYKRISATEAKKELRKIEKDFGLDKKEVKETNLREEIGEILEKNKESEEKNGVLWKVEDGEEKLKETLKNSAIKEYHLSENAKYCLESLQNCTSEDGKKVVTLPNDEFYKKYNELKNGKNKKEYIMVMDKLIKLRELKLKKEIERFKKLEIQLLNKEVENFENLLNDVKLATRVYEDEEAAKHLFVKDPKTDEFEELFSNYQEKEKDLRKLDERIVKIYDNLIFEEENSNPELIETFIDRIKYFENDRKNTINEVFDRAFANNHLDVMEKLLSNEGLKNKIYISNNLNYCNILINNAIISDKIDMAKILIQNNFNNNFKRLNENKEKIRLSMNEKFFINFKENLKNFAKNQIDNENKLKKTIKNIDDIKPITKNNKKVKENSLEINKKKFESLKGVMKDLGLSVEEGLQL